MTLINLFGDAMYFNIVELTDIQFSKLTFISDKSNIPKEELLVDLSVLQILGINSFDQFNVISSFGGIIYNNKTKFEYRNNRKLLRKIPLSELNNDGLLFPMYQINDLKIDLTSFQLDLKNRFVMVDILRGHIGKYCFDEEVKLGDIIFDFTTVFNKKNSERLLTNISYQSRNIINKSKDALIIKQYAEKL